MKIKVGDLVKFPFDFGIVLEILHTNCVKALIAGDVVTVPLDYAKVIYENR
jgi:hypothetical protein